MEKIKGWFQHSMTVFVTSIAGIFSLLLENIDIVAGSEIKQQILDAGFDPVSAGRFGLGVSVVALFARIRGLRK